jgi:hypothetical protein
VSIYVGNYFLPPKVKMFVMKISKHAKNRFAIAVTAVASAKHVQVTNARLGIAGNILQAIPKPVYTTQMPW